MAFRRDIFQKIGSFDETLGRIQKKLAIGEETEFFLRINQLLPGYSIILNPHAKVFHKTPPHRLTLRYFIKRAYEEGFSKARIRKKYRLHEEEKYLRYYFRHMDVRTLIVLCATGFGYLVGLSNGVGDEYT
jgi:GT2 family glycosyltransferase